MKNKKHDPANVYATKKLKNIVLDSSILVSIEAFKSSFNYPEQFYKPISKLF